MLLYRTFIEKSASLYDFVWLAAQIVFNEFKGRLGKFETAKDLFNVIYGKIRAIYNGSQADSWADLGGVLLDVADVIVSVTPLGNAYSVLKVLWQIGSLA
jgi:hypothetical protein